MILVIVILLFSRLEQLVTKIPMQEFDSKVGDCSRQLRIMEEVGVCREREEARERRDHHSGLGNDGSVSPSDFHGLCSSIHYVTFIKTIKLDIQSSIL
jgi:hypothetical protein